MRKRLLSLGLAVLLLFTGVQVASAEEALLEQIINDLWEIYEEWEGAAETAQKIKELIKQLEAEEPDSEIIARCLAYLMTELGDNLGVLSPWIEAYADTLIDAFDTARWFVRLRYLRLRKHVGFNHEEARLLATNDPETQAWLDEEYRPNNPSTEGDEPEEEASDAEQSEESAATAETSEGQESYTLWSEDDDECCKDRTKEECRPQLTRIQSNVYKDDTGRYIDFEFEVSHDCGLQAWYDTTTGSIMPSIQDYVRLGNLLVKVTGTGTVSRELQEHDVDEAFASGVAYSRTGLQIDRGRSPVVEVRIRAISKCIGLLATSIVFDDMGGHRIMPTP